MGMSKAELRRLARKQQAELRHADEEKERAAREAKERQQRERDVANENDVVEFLQASATIESARERFDAVTTKQKLIMGDVVGRIAGREGSVGRAARLLDISPHQASGLQRLASESAAPAAGDGESEASGRDTDDTASGPVLPAVTESSPSAAATGGPAGGDDEHVDRSAAAGAFERSA